MTTATFFYRFSQEFDNILGRVDLCGMKNKQHEDKV